MPKAFLKSLMAYLQSWRFSSGSQVASSRGQPFHLTLYETWPCSSFFSKILSTQYSWSSGLDMVTLLQPSKAYQSKAIFRNRHLTAKIQILFLGKCLILQRQMEVETVAVKLVVVGDGAVGKTCMLSCYRENRFPINYVPTVFQNCIVSLKIQQQIVNLGLWDTAGQEQFQKLRPLAYSNVDVFLLTYSVSDRSSFNHIWKKWVPEVKMVNPSAVVVVVGNKIDLRDERYNNPSIVKAEEGLRQAQRRKMIFRECSALTKQGLSQVFESAVREVLTERLYRQGQINKKSNCPSCQTM